ncbi:unnamed protein product [Closterium sp. Yama58-4]|nr:unnamed protein product [Closterium sp. Yama58-4]
MSVDRVIGAGGAERKQGEEEEVKGMWGRIGRRRGGSRSEEEAEGADGMMSVDKVTDELTFESTQKSTEGAGGMMSVDRVTDGEEVWEEEDEEEREEMWEEEDEEEGEEMWEEEDEEEGEEMREEHRALHAPLKEVQTAIDSSQQVRMQGAVV